MAQANDDGYANVAPKVAESTYSGSPHHTAHSATAEPASITGVVRRLSREFEDSRPAASLAAAASEEASTLAAAISHPHRTGPTTSSNMATLQDAPRAGAAIDEKTPGRIASVSDAASGQVPSSDEITIGGPTDIAAGATEPFDNGYHFPPKFKWQEATQHNLKAFWKFFITPMGFFWTIYGLNVVAWGGMLFLLLCNAAPAMCHPTCDDIDSPRRIWVEIDAQILTALFCVPAFGFIPWRFRDWWYLLKYRVQGDEIALRRLAGIHANWFRLKGSQELAVDIGPDNIPQGVPRDRIPFPESSMAVAPLTSTRAPPTAMWKLDAVIWSMVLNTFGQCALCGIMWGMNRYNRPSWATGFLVAIASVIAMVGGYIMFLEGKHVKMVEGVPLTDRDRQRLERDTELGIPHYNNFKDKKPKEKKEKQSKEKS